MLTKEELSGKCVYVPNKRISYLVQSKLFKMGYIWGGTGVGFYYPFCRERYYINIDSNLLTLTNSPTKPDLYKEIKYQKLIPMFSTALGKLIYGE